MAFEMGHTHANQSKPPRVIQLERRLITCRAHWRRKPNHKVLLFGKSNGISFASRRRKATIRIKLTSAKSSYRFAPLTEYRIDRTKSAYAM